jgi:signal transduction histidine kinase
MPAAGNWPFERVSFSRQFMLLVAAILAVAVAGIGAWLGRQIEQSAVNRAARVSASHVESVLTALLHDWPATGQLGEASRRALDRIFIEGPLRRDVVRFKLWDRSGTILYSDDHPQIGRRFPTEDMLAAAFEGAVQSHITELAKPDNHPENLRWPRLLEVYVPVHAGSTGVVTAVAEFYYAMDSIDEEILAAKWRSWLLVASVGAALYALTYNRVRRASDTIAEQQRGLRDQLQQLRASLAENEQMRGKLHDAGARSTTLNEQMLQRVAADLHDGPAQDLSFALLRFDDMARSCSGCTRAQAGVEHDLKAIPAALTSSLGEIRAIAAGLGAPGLAELPATEAAWRAVREGERKRGNPIEAHVGEIRGDVPLAVRITLYRLLQESIANSSRHAPSAPLRVRVDAIDGCIRVTVSDEGGGFDPRGTESGGHLGLALMRERVRLLGGSFELDTAPGSGTRIHASIPLDTEENVHA